MSEREPTLEEQIMNDLRQHNRTNDIDIARRISKQVREVRYCIETLEKRG